MPESSNIEIAHKLAEHRDAESPDAESPKQSWHDLVKVAFDAWLKTNPFSNPTAPPGPSFMPEYRNPQILQGAAANQEASRIFDEGTAARKQSEEYTGTTVVLATVLFLVALSPRFRSRRVRFVLLLLTGGLAVYALVTILGFPRL